MTCTERSQKRSISLFHWYLTDAGAITSAVRIPRLLRSSSAAAMAWIVLPRPMSSASTARPRLAANSAPRNW